MLNPEEEAVDEPVNRSVRVSTHAISSPDSGLVGELLEGCRLKDGVSTILLSCCRIPSTSVSCDSASAGSAIGVEAEGADKSVLVSSLRSKKPVSSAVVGRGSDDVGQGTSLVPGEPFSVPANGTSNTS